MDSLLQPAPGRQTYSNILPRSFSFIAQAFITIPFYSPTLLHPIPTPYGASKSAFAWPRNFSLHFLLPKHFLRLRLLLQIVVYYTVCARGTIVEIWFRHKNLSGIGRSQPRMARATQSQHSDKQSKPALLPSSSQTSAEVLLQGLCD